MDEAVDLGLVEMEPELESEMPDPVRNLHEPFAVSHLVDYTQTIATMDIKCGKAEMCNHKRWHTFS